MANTNFNLQSNVNNSSVVLAAQPRLSEMSNVFSYEGNNVTMRLENGVVFVNLTEVAKAFPDKNLTQIINSKEIQEYATKLATKLQIYSLADLVQVTRGGSGNHGTWAHQRVALRVAQKLSTDFAIWVDEKIEELLTTGRTSITQKVPTAKELALMVIQAEEEKERLMLENRVQQEQIAELIEQTAYTRIVLQSKATVSVTQIAQDYGMSAKKLNSILKEMGVQRKVGSQWILYAKFLKGGYVQSETNKITHKDGTPDVVLTTKWTQEGRLFLYNELKKKNIIPLIEKKGGLI